MAVGEQIPWHWFQIGEREDPDGRVRLVLLGHLDDLSAQELARCLDRLSRERRPARVDLSQLARIEPGGAQTILAFLDNARQIGWPLEVSFV